jgi:hypothetical protein
MGEAPAALAVDDATAQRTVARSGGAAAARTREGLRMNARRRKSVATREAIDSSASIRNTVAVCAEITAPR